MKLLKLLFPALFAPQYFKVFFGETGTDSDDDNAMETSNTGFNADMSPISSGGQNISYGPDGIPYPYGQYTGYDFDTYAWGDPTVGFQGTPDEAGGAWQTFYNDLAMKQDLSYSMPSYLTGRTGEEEFQYNQDMNNWAGPAANEQGAWTGWSGGKASPEAIAEYETMFAGDKGSRNYTYTDLDGSRNINPTAVAKGVLDALTTAPAQIGLAMTGMSPIAATLSILSNATDGKTTPAASTLASVLGGKDAGLVTSILGSLFEGNERGAAGNLMSAGLNYSGMNLGSLLGSEFNRGSVEQALASMVGSRGQGWGIGKGLDTLGIQNSGRSVASRADLSSPATYSSLDSNSSGGYTWRV